MQKILCIEVTEGLEVTEEKTRTLQEANGVAERSSDKNKYVESRIIAS